MGKFIEVVEIEPAFVGYIVKDNKIIKNYDNGTREVIDYSVDNEIDCLYELRNDIPNVKEFIQQNIDSIKREITFLNVYFGGSLYSALYYMDNKNIQSLILSGTLGVLALRRLKRSVQSIALKNLAARGDMRIYYTSLLTKRNNKLDEETICELVYSPKENDIEERNICELKSMREQLISSKEDYEKYIDAYRENEVFEKVYELH